MVRTSDPDSFSFSKCGCFHESTFGRMAGSHLWTCSLHLSFIIVLYSCYNNSQLLLHTHSYYLAWTILIKQPINAHIQPPYSTEQRRKSGAGVKIIFGETYSDLSQSHTKSNVFEISVLDIMMLSLEHLSVNYACIYTFSCTWVYCLLYHDLFTIRCLWVTDEHTKFSILHHWIGCPLAVHSCRAR